VLQLLRRLAQVRHRDNEPHKAPLRLVLRKKLLRHNETPRPSTLMKKVRVAIECCFQSQRTLSNTLFILHRRSRA
jgi:hypothetical protein